MPLDSCSWSELPPAITKWHVDADVAKYSQHRPVVMLECKSGWASYSAATGRRLTEHAKSWSKGLLDFADIVRGCIVEKTLAARLTYRLSVPNLGRTEGRI
jgi:hypothetical protein